MSSPRLRRSIISERGAPIRFLIAGAFNTLLTVVLYLGLLNLMSHAPAYTVAFVTGIVISYLLNRWFVFRSSRGLDTVVLFPLVYAVQYVVGLAVVLVWVDVLGLPAGAASIVAVMVTIPLTYLLSRWVFTRTPRRHEGREPGDPPVSS